MVEDTINVFIKYFCDIGDSFDFFLDQWAEVLKRCEDLNLVLNWEKFHYMAKEAIVLDHQILEKGIHVNMARVEVIENLPPPICIKVVRSFLRHAGLYKIYNGIFKFLYIHCAKY